MFLGVFYSGGNMTDVDGNTSNTGTHMDPKYSYDGDIGAVISSAKCAEAIAAGVHFGTGTTAPAETDINMESRITSGLSVSSSARISGTNDDGTYYYGNRCVLKNTTSEQISISEIGLIGKYGYYSGVSEWTKYFLIRRDVLSSPIVIAPGESKLVTYKLNFNQSQ